MRLQIIRITHPRIHRDGERFTRILIEYSQHLARCAIAQLAVNEIDAPDVIDVLGAQPDDGAVLSCSFEHNFGSSCCQPPI